MPSSTRRLTAVLILALLLPNAGQGQGQEPVTLNPGTTLFALDLSGTPVGEFPASLRLLNGIVAVVLRDGVPMLKASSPSEFVITLPQLLPSHFTLEFDLVPKLPVNLPQDLSFEGSPTINQGVASAHVLWHAGGELVVIGGGGNTYDTPMPEELRSTLPGRLTRVVAEFQGRTLKLYTNGRRLYTLDKLFLRGRVVRVFLGGVDAGDGAVYLAGVRVSTGSGLGIIAATAGLPSRGQPGQVPVPSPSPVPGAAPPPPPSSVNGVSVTPGAQGPLVNWVPVAIPASYSVRRWKSTDPACCNSSSPGLSGPPWQDAPLPTTGNYLYEVTATFAGGSATGQAQFNNLAIAGAGGTIQQTGAAGTGTSGSTGAPINTGGSLVKPLGSLTPIVMNDATPPTVTVTPVPAGLRISWDAVAGANQYLICRESPPGSQCVPASISGSTVAGNTISEVDLGLAPGSLHAYRVSALRPDFHFGESGSVTGTAGALPAPTNLRVLQVNTTGPTLVLEWDPIQYTAWNGTKTLTTYQVTGTGLAGPQLVNGTQATLPLSNGPGTYSWQVTSVIPNSAGGWQAGTPSGVFPYVSAAKYRLVALGVKALKQSADDIFAVDGITDEIYVAAIANTTTRAMTGSGISVARSNTYGDIGTANAFPGRVQGGTASPHGGIRSGDVVPIVLNPGAATGSVYTTGFPLVLWEGLVDDNTMVLVSPSLWEEDVDKKLYGVWEGAIRYDIQAGYPKGLAALITALRDQDALGPAVGTGGLMWCGQCVNGVDRPVGLQLSTGAPASDPNNYYLAHQVLVLTRSAIERALASSAQVAGGLSGTFKLSMFEGSSLMSAMYELYVRVERAP